MEINISIVVDDNNHLYILENVTLSRKHTSSEYFIHLPIFTDDTKTYVAEKSGINHAVVLIFHHQDHGLSRLKSPRKVRWVNCEYTMMVLGLVCAYRYVRLINLSDPVYNIYKCIVPTNTDILYGCFYFVSVSDMALFCSYGSYRLS